MPQMMCTQRKTERLVLSVMIDLSSIYRRSNSFTIFEPPEAAS
jgi:hypothetical protein